MEIMATTRFTVMPRGPAHTERPANGLGHPSTANMAGFASQAQFTSMDGDGFTMNFVTNAVGPWTLLTVPQRAERQAEVVSEKLRHWSGCPAACVQPVSAVEFQPAAVLFASMLDVPQANTRRPRSPSRLAPATARPRASRLFLIANGLGTTDVNEIDRSAEPS